MTEDGTAQFLVLHKQTALPLKKIKAIIAKKEDCIIWNNTIKKENLALTRTYYASKPRYDYLKWQTKHWIKKQQ